MALGLLLSATSARAQDLMRGGPKVRWIASLGYYAADGVSFAEQRVLAAGEDQLRASGSQVTASRKTSGGFGAGVGALFPFYPTHHLAESEKPIFKLGPLLEYIAGPRTSVHADTVSSGGQPGTVDYHSSYDAVRLLLIVAKNFPLTERLSFRVAAGGGWTKLHVSRTFQDSTSPAKTVNADGSGATYRVSAALDFALPRVNLGVGMSYSVFPSVRPPFQLPISWSPLGVFVSVAY